MLDLPHRLADIARSHRLSRDSKIPLQLDKNSVPSDPSKLYQTSGHLSAKQITIVEHDATELAQLIASKRYTSLEVTEAYILAACIAHAGTNCLAWLDPAGARERAKWLDERLKQMGRTVGPLHGVPLSVKDFVNIAEIPQSSGHISSIFTPAEDAHLIDIFREAGAVFMAKTTQPQSIMHLETSSHIFGTTTCAHNSALTSGGSSGGEGALVGCRGSPWGISTDVGGSTRNPAANNGLWGFKPSTKRVPRSGITGITSTSRIGGTIGPVCHSRRDIDLWMSVVLGARPWLRDVSLVNLPWREVSAEGQGFGFEGWSGQNGRLVIGVMRDDGVVRPVRPIQRAMDALVGKLRQHGGVDIVDFEPKWSAEGWTLTSRLYYMDGGERLREALGDEPMVPLTQFITQGLKPLSLGEVNELVAQRNSLRQRFLDHFTASGIDILLCPNGPAPAQPVGTTKYWPYTSMWNLLDWPAAVFPTGLYVEASDTQQVEAANDDERHLYQTYDVRVAAGSSIGLQVVAPRWRDERLMAALRTIEQVLPLKSV